MNSSLHRIRSLVEEKDNSTSSSSSKRKIKPSNNTTTFNKKRKMNSTTNNKEWDDTDTNLLETTCEELGGLDPTITNAEIIKKMSKDDRFDSLVDPENRSRSSINNKLFSIRIGKIIEQIIRVPQESHCLYHSRFGCDWNEQEDTILKEAITRHECNTFVNLITAIKLMPELMELIITRSPDSVVKRIRKISNQEQKEEKEDEESFIEEEEEEKEEKEEDEKEDLEEQWNEIVEQLLVEIAPKYNYDFVKLKKIPAFFPFFKDYSATSLEIQYIFVLGKKELAKQKQQVQKV